jgi:hypothetical protein
MSESTSAATGSNGHAKIQPPAPYLLERGFSATAILEVGWRVEPLGPDRCRRYGLPAEAGAAQVWVIPYLHQNGRVWFERIRLIRDEDIERFGGGKYRQPGGRDLALYDPYLVLGVDNFEPLDSALLIEGDANTVAAHSLLPDLHVIGLPGHTIKPSMAERLAAIPVIYLWIDRHDPHAEDNAQRIVEQLKAAEPSIEVRQLPPAPGRMDANDMLRQDFEHSRRLVLDMLDAAAPVEPPIDDDWPLMPKPTPPRFPVDAFPETIRAFVEAVAAQTQTPADMAAMGVLGVLSAVAMGAKVDCGAWDEEALGLYVLVVSPSGDHKSTVLKKIAAPLYRLEQEARAEAKATKAEHDTRREMLKARKEMLVKKASKLEEEDEWAETQAKLEEVSSELAETSEYVEPRLLADDATPEGLAKLMAKHADGIAVISAESAIINNLLGHYSDQGRANLHVVCKAVNGEGPVAVDRGTAEPLFIARPLLAITLFAQPHVLKGVLGHDTARDQGLVGRFIYADLEPASTLGRRDYSRQPPKVPQHLQEAWTHIVQKVFNSARALTKLPEPPNSGSEGGSVSFVSDFDVGDLSLTLSSSSHRLIAELLTGLEPRQREDGDLRTFADWLSRHHGRVARIAALLHLTEHPPEREIGEQTMRPALRIGEYLFEHMLVALSTPNPTVRRALAWLAKQDAGEVSQRHLQRGPLNYRGLAPDAAELAQSLVAIGALRPILALDDPAPNPKGGRPPGPRYEINPRLRQLGRSHVYEPGARGI